MSSTVAVGPGVFKLGKETLLSEVDKRRDDLSSGQRNKSTAKLAEISQTWDEDTSGLNKKLRKRDGRADELNVWADF